MENGNQLWKRIYIDRSVFKIPEDVRFVQEAYFEHDTIHIQLYKSETIQVRIRIVSFDVANFEMLKTHIQSQVNTQDTTIGGHKGYISEGEYDFIKEFNFPDYNARNNVNISIHSSEDSFYGLNYNQFIAKMFG